LQAEGGFAAVPGGVLSCPYPCQRDTREETACKGLRAAAALFPPRSMILLLWQSALFLFASFFVHHSIRSKASQHMMGCGSWATAWMKPRLAVVRHPERCRMCWSVPGTSSPMGSVSVVNWAAQVLRCRREMCPSAAEKPSWSDGGLPNAD